jgi:hypothetical protein
MASVKLKEGVYFPNTLLLLKKSIKDTYRLLSDHYLLVTAFVVISIISTQASNLVIQKETLPIFWGIIYWLVFFAEFLLLFVITKFSLNYFFSKKVNLQNILPTFMQFIRSVILLVLSGIILVFGLFLFIIPGIIFLINYFFAYYVLVEKNTGIIGSFKESFKITTGIRLVLLPIVALVVVVVSMPFVFTYMQPNNIFLTETITDIIGVLSNIFTVALYKVIREYRA